MANPQCLIHHKKSFTAINQLIFDQRDIVNKQEKANSINDYFCNIGNKLTSEIPDNEHQYLDFMSQSMANPFYLGPITADDTSLEMNRLKQYKSPDHELIGSKATKLCPEIYASNL